MGGPNATEARFARKGGSYATEARFVRRWGLLTTDARFARKGGLRYNRSSLRSHELLVGCKHAQNEAFFGNPLSSFFVSLSTYFYAAFAPSKINS